MTTLLQTRTGMLTALLVLLVMLGISLWRRSRNASSAIDLDDLLLGDDGKLSKAAAVMLGAFFLTSWIMVHLTATDKMTEGYLAIYVAAWIAPTVTRLIVNAPKPPTIQPPTVTGTQVNVSNSP